MPTTVQNTYFADDRAVGMTGIDTVTLPHTCNSIRINFGTGLGGYALRLNYNEDNGAGTPDHKHFGTSTVFEKSNFHVRSIEVRAAAGATWGYMAFIDNDSGCGYSF